MKLKLYMMLTLLGVGLVSVSSVWAAACNSPYQAYDMTVLTSGVGGSTSCDSAADGNAEWGVGDGDGVADDVIVNPGGAVIFSNVTDLSGLVTLGTGTPTGTFSIDSSLWDSWSEIKIILKNSSSYAVFSVTEEVLTGTWTAPPQATGESLSHYLAFAGGDTDIGQPPPVPLPAAVWLFGSGLVGLIGFSRRKSTSALQA